MSPPSLLPCPQLSALDGSKAVVLPVVPQLKFALVMLWCWKHLWHLMCLRFTAAECLLFIMKRELDLGEIEVTLTFRGS